MIGRDCGSLGERIQRKSRTVCISRSVFEIADIDRINMGFVH